MYWVAILYFAEGFPFGLIKDALPVFFRVHGVRLADIGLLTLVGLPWSLKFLWAPAVDLWGKRRTWILGCQTLLIVGILTLLAVDPSRVTAALWVLLFSLAILSATQDIVIDAFRVESLEVDAQAAGMANFVMYISGVGSWRSSMTLAPVNRGMRAQRTRISGML